MIKVKFVWDDPQDWRCHLEIDLLQRMLDLGLEVERESTIAFDLIRFIKQQIGCKDLFSLGLTKDIDEIKTINIELEHRVAKLIAENEHLKQTYKQLYDSIEPSCVRAKEHAESLVNQLNQKSVEITDLNAQLQKNSMFDARHELCFLEFVSDTNASSKSKITTTNKVPLRGPIPLEVVAQESVVTKVYTRRPKTNGSNSKPKIAKSMISNKMKPSTSRGSNTSVAPSSSFINLRCGYYKNPKKTVKNWQTRTRKSTQKARRKLSKSNYDQPSVNLVNKSQGHKNSKI
ncbi:hypothetical protein Tco_1337053 [Tanacetum coccineum]